jgi:uncharacterized ParB-like nuclease family protein
MTQHWLSSRRFYSAGSLSLALNGDHEAFRLEVGQQTPILVRRDGDRFVLVHGLHRLEACKALGEETIYGYLTQAPKH